MGFPCDEKTEVDEGVGGWGEMILHYTCFLMGGGIREEMRSEVTGLRLTLRVLHAASARDTVKNWSVLRLSCVWQSLLPLGVMQQVYWESVCCHVSPSLGTVSCYMQRA